MSVLSKITESFGGLRVAVRSVLADAWHHRRAQLITVVLLSAALGLVPYAVNGSQAYLLNQLVVAAKSMRADQWLYLSIALVGAAFFLRAIVAASYQFSRKLSWMDRRQHYDFRLIEKLASLDVATHEDPVFQDELTLLREQGASFAVTNFLDSLVANLQNLTGVIAASVIVGAVDWRYLAIVVAANLPQLYGQLRYGEGLWHIHQSQSPERRMYNEMSRHTGNARGVRELHTFQSGGFFLGRLKGLVTRFLDAEKLEERKRFRFSFMAELCSLLGVLAIISMLVGHVIGGGLQVGTFMLVLTSVFGLEGTLSSFFIQIADQRSESRLVAAYFAIMEREPKIRSKPTARPLAVTKAPEIEFRNVSFAYPSTPDKPVLHNLSLTVHSGERVALVGVNGAGKSTLIKLLCRFYDPTEGAIYIDGVDLRDLDLENWYRHLALLSQDFERYHLEAWENIALGRYDPTLDPSHVGNAARRSQAHLFIETWRDRYRQQLGQEFGGPDPSGGQWQKIALARTFFRDGFVTILDEPTAHVDAGAEAEIFELLQSELSRSQTLFLISHRFSTVRRADRICVLKDGQVAELGSHLELVSKNGLYADLFEKQAEGYR